MSWFQKLIQLSEKDRGFHLITDELESKLPELSLYQVGLAHIFIQHTSASLTLNENTDPDVRHDMETFSLQAIPDSADYYRHVLEGADDMPAHIKSSLWGASVMIPVTKGRFNLGTWQGLWLGEHKQRGGKRRLIVTLQGHLYR
ncbi:secondary thiamine-phosphate synthase enzyme YjbQ [Endozoicomonas sp. 8E]|uniref:secondary thiamine-phosphate synthase enzyme YjbQ n=1 Tax=Endozoicomonas sp. 8E TaxID=3035692 RepID=UPI002939548A|nr:secondary thiamine-phosphate synthase enzyme YjbQ [Endozoicomonas sp. 8E]WOG27373.1 secondary thiamine-phosphate synthase enzyme YjbQ [Endozoicomonas sp. 8E]